MKGEIMISYRAAASTLLCFLCAISIWAGEGRQETAKVEFRRAEEKAAEGLTEATVEGTKRKVYLNKVADATNADIKSALEVEDNEKKPVVAIFLTKDGVKKLAKVSQEHMGKLLAIVVDGKVVSVVTIRSLLNSEGLQITGLAKKEAEKLVKTINGN
jgi:preprotein translocase subunit SecD